MEEKKTVINLVVILAALSAAAGIVFRLNADIFDAAVCFGLTLAMAALYSVALMLIGHKPLKSLEITKAVRNGCLIVIISISLVILFESSLFWLFAFLILAAISIFIVTIVFYRRLSPEQRAVFEQEMKGA